MFSRFWIVSGNGVINGSDQSAVTIASFRIGPAFTGKIGDSGTPWKIGPCTYGWINSNAAAIYIQPSDAGSALPELYIEGGASGDDAIYLVDGTVTTAIVSRCGRFRIGAGVIIGTLHTTFERNRRSDANVTIESGAALTTIDQFGGIITNRAAGGTINQYDGEFNHEGNSTMDITALNLLGNDALFRFRSQGGTITTANGKAGLLDCRGGNTRKRIITTLNTWKGFTADLRTGLNSVAITNAINRQGGEVLGDPGRDYTLSAIPAA